MKNQDSITPKSLEKQAKHELKLVTIDQHLEHIAHSDDSKAYVAANKLYFFFLEQDKLFNPGGKLIINLTTRERFVEDMIGIVSIYELESMDEALDSYLTWRETPSLFQ